MDVQVSSAALPMDRYADFWRDISRETFGFDHGFTDRSQAEALVRLGRLGPMTLFDCRVGGMTMLDRGRAEAAMTDGLLSVYLQIEGDCRMQHARGDLALSGGEAMLLDMGRPVRALQGGPGCRIIGVMIEEDHLLSRLASRDASHLVQIGRQTPLGGLVTSYIRSLVDAPTPLRRDQMPQVGDNLLDLVAIAAGASSELRDIWATGGAARVKLPAIRAFIKAHLSEPLSPALVARRFGFTPRYLHKMFESTGQTFSEFVTAQRLDACRADIEDAGQSHRTIADIAYGWGFNDLSHFGRRFRAAFGCNPRDLRSLT